EITVKIDRTIPSLVPDKEKAPTEKDDRAIQFVQAKRAMEELFRVHEALKRVNPAKAAPLEEAISGFNKQFEVILDDRFMYVTPDKEALRQQLISQKLPAIDKRTAERVVIIMRAEMSRAVYLPGGPEKLEAFNNTQAMLETLSRDPALQRTVMGLLH